MIADLHQYNVISILQEILTDGHSPLKVWTDDNRVFIIKSAQGKMPAYYLISEFLCGYFLQLWNIKTPQIAAVKLPIQLLSTTPYLSDRHKPRFYENTLCFGSELIQNILDLNLLLETIEMKRIANPIDLLKIALFDIWVENDDRKPTNNNIIVQVVDKKYYFNAIDHAYVFNSLNYENLNSSYGVTNTYNESIMNTKLAKTICSQTLVNDKLIKEMEFHFFSSVYSCFKNFDAISSNIPTVLGYKSNLKEKIRLFLFDEHRNKLVFKEFINRLNFDLEP